MPKIIILAFLASIFCVSCSTSDSSESPTDDENNVENNDDGEIGQEEPSIPNLLKATESTFFENQLDRIRTIYFESNKRTLDSIFNENNEFSLKTVYSYNSNGLLEKIMSFGIDGSISSENSIEYENERINKIIWSENTLQGIVSATDNITYEENFITVQRTDDNGNTTYSIQYSLNEEGLIFKQENGQTTIEISYDDNLPTSKNTTTGNNTETITYNYLDSPNPKGPWSDFWKNQFGSINNQLLFSFDGGLFSIERNTDLEKYLTGYSNFFLTYEFNDDDLPTSIVKESGSLRTEQNLEYEE